MIAAKNDLWKVKDLSGLSKEDLNQLKKFKDEIDTRKKTIRSIKLNLKLNKKSNKMEGIVKKAKNESYSRIFQIKKEIREITEIGKKATKQFSHAGYLNTYVDKAFVRKFNDLSKTDRKIKIAESKKFYSVQKKNIDDQYVKKRKEIIKKVSLKEFLNMVIFFKYTKEIRELKRIKIARLEKKSEFQKVYSFVGDLNKEKAEISKNLFETYWKEYDEKLTLIKYHEKNFNSTYGKKYLPFTKIVSNEDKQKISTKYKELRRNIFVKFKLKEISYRAFKEEIKKSFKFKKQEMKNLETQNDKFRNQKEIEDMRKSFSKFIKSSRQSISDELNEVNKRYPVEMSTMKMWLILPLATFIPGFSFLIRGQWKVGILYLLTIPILVLLGMYAFGMYNINGKGILGLGDLGANDPFSDSRFYVIEGVIGMIFLVIIMLFLVGNFRANYVTLKLMISGIAAPTWTDTKKSFQKNGYPYVISIPALLIILLVVVVPILATFIFSFTNYGYKHIPPGQIIQYVGFSNYQKLLASTDVMLSFQRVILWTIAFTILSSVLTILVGIALGILTHNARLKGKKTFRVIFLLPTAIPSFITIMMIGIMFAPGGLIAKFTGVDTWKTDLWYARLGIIIVQTWVSYSGAYLMTIGIINSVPGDQKEAAHIDGVPGHKQFRHLVMPIILYQLTPLIVSTFMATFNNYGIIYLFTNGGPAYDIQSAGNVGATDTVISFVFKLTSAGSTPFHGLSAALLLLSTMLVLPISAFALLRSRAVRKEGI